MSGLRNLFGGGSQAAVTPDYTGLQIQTAVNTLPIALVWGVNKIAPNVVWYNNFMSFPTPTGSSGRGGKGGIFTSNSGNSNSYSYSYSYSASVIMALAEGPITGVGQVWRGQSIYTLASLGLSLFIGSTPQSAWSYLTTNYPAQALAYQGTAYVAGANYNLSDSATLDNHNFEVQGLQYNSGYNPSGLTVDADPSLVVNDFLTGAQFGVGFPSGSIDTTTLFGASGDSSYQTYCRAAGLALSPALTDQEQASSILARWLQLTNTAAVWSGGLLRFIPYGDLSISGNGVTFNADATPIYDLGDDDFLATDGEDPLQVNRSDPFEAYNVWRLEVSDRTNAYNLTTVESRDQNAIELYGMRIAPTVTAHEICDTTVALISGQLQVQRAVYIRNTYKFKLSWEYCLLDPMDLVTVTDIILGLNKQAVRITDIEEDDSGFLQVTAEEFPLGVATATLYDTASASGTTQNRNIAVDPVNPPFITQPTATLAVGAPAAAQIYVGISGGAAGVADPNWGGAVVWLSVDGQNYANVGTIRGPAKQGTLTASLAAYGGTNPDATHTIAINLAESAGVIPASATVADAQVGASTLCIVDSELLSYETATLTSANNYALTELFRGLYGTSAVSHGSAASFMLVDGNVFKYTLPAPYQSRVLLFKFQSFNVFGGGLQDISTCAVYEFAPSGVPNDHPVAIDLLLDSSMDFGLVTQTVGTADDFGTPAETIEFYCDLGVA